MRVSIVAAVLPPSGGSPQLTRIETTDRAIGKFIERLGGPAGLAVCYEACPGGYALWRLLCTMGVACDRPVAGSRARRRSGEDRPA